MMNKENDSMGTLLILLILGVFKPFLMTLTTLCLLGLFVLAYVYYYCLGLRGKNTFNSISTEWIVGTVVLLVIMVLLGNNLTNSLNLTLFSSLCYGIGILDRQQLLLGE